MQNSSSKNFYFKGKFKTILIATLLFFLGAFSLGIYSFWKKYLITTSNLEKEIEDLKTSLKQENIAFVSLQNRQLSFEKKMNENLSNCKKNDDVPKFLTKIQNDKIANTKKDKNFFHRQAVLFAQPACGIPGLEKYRLNDPRESIYELLRKDCRELNSNRPSTNLQTGLSSGFNVVDCKKPKILTNRYSFIEFVFDQKQLLQMIFAYVNIPSKNTPSAAEIEKNFEAEMDYTLSHLRKTYKQYKVILDNKNINIKGTLPSFLSFYRQKLSENSKWKGILFTPKIQYSNIRFHVSIEKEDNLNPYGYEIIYECIDRSKDHNYSHQHDFKNNTTK